MVLVLEEIHTMVCNVIMNMTSGATMYDNSVQINLLCYKTIYIYISALPEHPLLGMAQWHSW